MELKRCANCAIDLKTNSVILDLGFLKSGEEICQYCWKAMLKLDGSKGPKMNRFTLEELIYKLSSFKKSIYQKELEAALLSEENKEAAIPDNPQQESPVENTSYLPDNNTQETTPATQEPATEHSIPEENAVTSRSEARLAAVGITRSSYPELWQVKELEDLAKVLTEKEKVVSALKGTYGLEPSALIATNGRFILLSKSQSGGDTAEVYELSWILSLESTVVGAVSDVTFRLSSNTITLMDADRERAVSFCDTVRPLLNP